MNQFVAKAFGKPAAEAVTGDNFMSDFCANSTAELQHDENYIAMQKEFDEISKANITEVADELKTITDDILMDINHEETVDALIENPKLWRELTEIKTFEDINQGNYLEVIYMAKKTNELLKSLYENIAKRNQDEAFQNVMDRL